MGDFFLTLKNSSNIVLSFDASVSGNSISTDFIVSPFTFPLFFLKFLCVLSVYFFKDDINNFRETDHIVLPCEITS